MTSMAEHVANLAASWCSDGNKAAETGEFQFLAEGFCLSVFYVEAGEHWAWRITREKSGFVNGGSKAPIAEAHLALFEAWVSFAELVRTADPLRPRKPNVTQKRWAKAGALLIDALAVLARERDNLERDKYGVVQ
jgi:hypothetical protein